MKKHYGFILGIALLLVACQKPEGDIQLSKADMAQSISLESVAEDITFIYRYNAQRSKLEWAAVKLENATGDKLKDALNALLEEYRQRGFCEELKLLNLTSTDALTTIYLSGNAHIKSKQDSTIFWSALHLTINRYTPSTDYRLAISG